MTIRNMDFEKFCKRIDKSIKATEAHFDISNLAKIIAACRLTPSLDIIDVKEPKVFRTWNDEFLSVIKLSNGKIEIDVRDENNGTTDLFFGCSPDYWAEHSVSYATVGNRLVFFCEDGFIRTFDEESLRRVSSLSIGYEILVKMVLGKFGERLRK